MRRRLRHGLAAFITTITCGSGACVTHDSPEVTVAGGAPGASAPASMGGAVTLDGSSTLFPVAKLTATAFQQSHPAVVVNVHSSGTGAGLGRLCNGEVDIAGASRPINAAESEHCQQKGVAYVELPVAFDSLSVVVSSANRFVDCLTIGELKTLWEPGAQGKITRWRQVRSSFPDEAIALFGPGEESGTFDYFTLAINGAERSSRRDYTASEDDTVIVGGVGGSPDALGYVGYSYYAANRDKLKLVGIDNGAGCVVPSTETVLENRYQPLSRPLFIYVSAKAAARTEVRAFAHFFVAPASARFSLEAGYVPLPAVSLLSVSRRLDRGTTGSIFGGHGSVLGVTAERFVDEDKVQSALVR